MNSDLNYALVNSNIFLWTTLDCFMRALRHAYRHGSICNISCTLLLSICLAASASDWLSHTERKDSERRVQPLLFFLNLWNKTRLSLHNNSGNHNSTRSYDNCTSHKITLWKIKEKKIWFLYANQTITYEIKTARGYVNRMFLNCGSCLLTINKMIY
jgi:hypothetical protein